MSRIISQDDENLKSLSCCEQIVMEDNNYAFGQQQGSWPVNRPLGKNISASTAATSRPLRLYRNPESFSGKLSLVRQNFGDVEPPESHSEELKKECADNYSLNQSGSGLFDYLTG